MQEERCFKCVMWHPSAATHACREPLPATGGRKERPHSRGSRLQPQPTFSPMPSWMVWQSSFRPCSRRPAGRGQAAAYEWQAMAAAQAARHGHTRHVLSQLLRCTASPLVAVVS